MKKIVLVMAIVFMAAKVEASSQEESFDFTGYTYYKDDVVGWAPANVPASDADYGGYTTTHAAENTTGIAFKFVLDEPTFLKSIIFDEEIVNEERPAVEDFDAFKISIYDTSICSPYMCRPGEKITDRSYVPGHLAYQSDWLVFSDKQYRKVDANGNTIEANASLPAPYLNNETAADLKLDTGEHWVSVEWWQDDAPALRSAKSHVDNFRYTTAPEPASLLLMGGGLAGMIWRRRKDKQVSNKR
jgi:hypothetical protein